MSDCKLTTNHQDRRSRALLALHETGLALGSQLDHQGLLSLIITYAADLLNASAGAALYLYHAEQNVLQVEAAVGFLSECVGNVLAPGEGLGGRVFASGKPIIVEDYQHWEGRSPKYKGDFSSRTMLGVPLYWHEQVIGVLNVQADHKLRTFDEEDIWIAELFAAQAALAINNTRLYEAERIAHLRADTFLKTSRAFASTLSQEEIFSTIFEQARTIIPYTTASIIICDGETLVDVATTGFEDIQDDVREKLFSRSRAIKTIKDTNRPLIIPDTRQFPDWINLPGTHHIRSWMGIPLLAQEKLVGILMLDGNRAGAFTDDHVEMAEALVSQAALAIQNARLFTQTQKSLNLNEALSKTSRALIAANSYEALLDAFVTPIARRQPTNAILYSLECDPAGRPRYAISIAGIVQEAGMFLQPLGMRYPVKKPLATIISKNASDNRPIIDIAQTDSLIDDSGLEANAIIPLVTYGKRWVGYIAVSWSQPFEFSPEDDRLYRLLAPQMAALVENHRLLEESHQSRERFADIAMSTQDWLWEINADGYFTYSSERVSEVLGYSSEEITWFRWYDVLSPVTPDQESELLEFFKAGEPFNRLIGWLRHKEGNTVCLEFSGTPIFDSGEHLIGYRGVGRDVTDQRDTEQRELLAYEVGQRLSGVLSIAQLMHEVVTQVQVALDYYHVHIRLFDPKSNRLTVMAGTGKAGQRMEEARDGISLDAEPSLVARAARTLTPVVSNDVRSDPYFLQGTYLPETRSEVALPLFRGQRLLGVLDVQAIELGRFGKAEVRTLQGLAAQVSIAIDNAYLFQALEQQAEHLEELVQERTAEIIQERERLNAIVENAGEGIIFTSPSGKIEYVNPAWVELTGFSSQEAVGSRVRQLFRVVRPPEQVRELLRAVQKKEYWHGELRMQRPDGAEYDAGMSVAPVLNNGKLVNLVSVMRDISAQKQIERMRTKFVANVSHELRTPITNLKIYQTLVRSGAPEKREAYLDTLANELGRLERLVEGLLDLSRIDRGGIAIKPELIDVNKLVLDVLQAHLPRAEKRSLQIKTDLATDLPRIFVDPELIMQVLTNLLANAINYTAVGDQVGIRTQTVNDFGSPRVMVEVWDTGVGIAPHDLPFLFNRFFRGETSKATKAPGTGLGLSIAKEIIDLHHGQIKVESKLNEGSRFMVYLPKGVRVSDS